MRTNLLVGLVLCGLTAWCVTSTGLAERNSGGVVQVSGGAVQAAAMSPAFAGTFLVTIVTQDGSVLQVLATVHQDGTLIVSDTTDFGGNFPDAHLDSPAYGSWRISGNQQTSSVFLHFSYDDDGTLMFIGRTDLVSDLLPGGEETSGEGAGRIYFPGQDPLDPDDGFPAGTFTFTGQRVNPL